MWLKLRMPFFADFNKKSLKVIADRFVCLDFRPDKIVTKFDKPADQMYIVLSGTVASYNKTVYDNIQVDQKPSKIYKAMDRIGEECMMGEMNWMSTTKTLSKCKLITLHRRDLIDSLTLVEESE